VSLGAGDVLAGPIVRRVEPTLVSVWIALRKPVEVRLEVFAGLGPRRPADAVAPTSTPTPVAPPQQAGHTLMIGAGLHVAVIMFEPHVPLAWNAIYAYDVRLTPDDGGGEVGLGELGMLVDGEYTGWFGQPRALLALGYLPDHLPSFMLPAAQPRDLRIAHGSCRRDDGPGRDAMRIVDDLLRDHHADPSQRLQQLWLTGDQIYANSAAAELMEACTEVGHGLVAGAGPGGEQVALTDSESGTEYTYPLDGFHFPAGRRLMLMNRVGGFTAEGNTAHSIGFGEFAAVYLAAWHTNVWPDLLAKLQARAAAVIEFQAQQDEMERLGREVEAYTRAQGRPALSLGTVPNTPHRLYQAWRLTPSAARAIDANLTDTDVDKQWDDVDYDHRGTWTGFWSQADSNALLRPQCEPYKRLRPAPRPAASPDPALGFLSRSLTPSWWAGKETFSVERDEAPEDPPRALLGDKVRERLHHLKQFLDDVPRARRALANVATYMVFDDHEVCEDWNITAGWVTKVRSTALGRQVLRNGMAACAVFQGWGNDPRAYATAGSPQAAALAEIAATLVDASGRAHTAHPVAAENALDLRFANQPLTSAPPSDTARMRWNYRYDGPGFEILALDSRTERSYEPEADPEIGQPFTSAANAPLVTDESMDRQIPPTAAPGVGTDGVCIVIAAAPVFGFPPEESVLLPLKQFIDLKTPLAPGRWEDFRGATHFGRVTEDPEHWGMVPRTYERLLARLSSRRRVVFLSGDVHYACSHAMTYWRRDGASYATTRFVQFTSSGFRNDTSNAMLLSLELFQMLARAFAVPIERLGWHQVVGADPVSPPATGPITRFNGRLEYLLQHEPIVLPARALPPGTRQQRPPDWAYRREMLEDRRDDLDRLAGLLPPPLLPAADGIGVMAQSVAARVRWQAIHAPGRRWIPRSNMGVVTFHGPVDAPVARHSLYTFDLSDPLSPGRPYVVVDAPLAARPDEQAPAVPTEGATP